MWNLAESRGGWLDVVLNLYFFMPLGILLGIQFRSKPAYFLSFLGLAAFTVTVEIAQAYIPGRYSSLRDVLLNCLGGFAGLLLANLPIFDRELLSANVRRAFADLGAITLVAMYGIFQFFPFFPVLRVSTLQRFLDNPVASNQITFELLELFAYASFAVLIWGHNHSPRSTAIFALLGTALTPAQIFLWGRSTTPAQVGASLLGLWIGLALSKRTQWIEPRKLAAVALAFLIWRQLQPFQWTAGSLDRFQWIPFLISFEISRDAALRILALKCFLYWFTVVQIHRAFKTTIWKSALGVASFVLIAEFGQCFQPSRSPEITDPLLCMLAVVPLWKFDNQKLRACSASPKIPPG